MTTHEQSIAGPAIEVSFLVLEGLVVVQLEQNRSLIIPAGGSWPGLQFLPEPLAAYLKPVATMKIPGTRLFPLGDKGHPAAVALVTAQALTTVGSLAERCELAEQLHIPIREVHQATGAAVVGADEWAFATALNT